MILFHEVLKDKHLSTALIRYALFFAWCTAPYFCVDAQEAKHQDSTTKGQSIDYSTGKEELKSLIGVYLDLSAVSSVDVAAVSRTQYMSAKNAAATVTTITAEQIRARGYTSLTDVLMDLPDYKIEGLANQESVNRINVRGVFGQDKFIVLLDGVRISSPTNEFMPLLENYPVHLALQIEVIYSPASSLYGADAVMGVINIVSKRSFDMDGPVEASSSGSMYSRFQGNILAGFTLNDNINVMMGAQYMYDPMPDMRQFYPEDYGRENTLQTGIFRTGFGIMRPQSPIRQQWGSPISANAQWLKVEAAGLTVSLFRSYARSTTCLGYPQYNAVYNDDVFFAPTLTMLSGMYQAALGRTTLISSVVYSQYELDPISNYRNLFNNLGPGYKYAFGSMFKVEQLVQHAWSDRLTVSGSLTAEYFISVPKTTDLESPMVSSVGLPYLQGRIFGTANARNPLGIDADIFYIPYLNVGGFVQAQWTPISQLNVNVGGRYDANSLFGASLNPRFGAVWSPSRSFTAKVMYGTAFLGAAPRYAFEQYGSFSYDSVNNTYTGSFWKLANPNLKPITSQTAELVLLSFLNDDVSLTASGFMTALNGLFREVPDASTLNLYGGRYKGYPVSTIVIFTNQGRQVTYGATLSAQYIPLRNQTTRVELFGALSWIDGRISLTDNESEGREIPYVSPLAFKGGVQLNHERLQVSARVIWQDRQRTVPFQSQNPQRRQTIDGYTLVNLTARYTLLSWLEAFVRVDNVLDARYRVVADLTHPEAVTIPQYSEIEFLRGTPQLPLRATVGVQLTFGRSER
ncbi:MAG: TonB-dependent receptor [Bacteroidota bacterium]|nr:TonB-dependent receptor [Candidatus Kapabacteria bacterium]MDW8218925.1 TonB-dependent receptor [Bacteroidota bacterium]